MGFDLSIDMCLGMCTTTGKPYSYDKDFKKCYDIPSVEIPEELRKYLEQRGPYLHIYTSHFNEQDRYDVNVNEFLEEFPSWEDVLAHPNYDEEYWTEEEHTTFLKLLKLCAKSTVSFRVSWSY